MTNAAPLHELVEMHGLHLQAWDEPSSPASNSQLHGMHGSLQAWDEEDELDTLQLEDPLTRGANLLDRMVRRASMNPEIDQMEERLSAALSASSADNNRRSSQTSVDGPAYPYLASLEASLDASPDVSRAD